MKTHRLIMAEEDKSIEIAGFTAVIKSLKRVEENLANLSDYTDYLKLIIKKQEEIKSAILATNISLKKPEKFPEIKFPDFPKPLPFPEIRFPDIPKTDLTETNKLLKQLLEKKDDIKVTLKLK